MATRFHKIPLQSKAARMKVVEGTKKDRAQDKEIKNLKASIKRINREEELKFIDTFQNAAVTTTATITSLVPCIQGFNDQTRIGNQISVTSIQWRGRISNAGAATTANVFRLIIGWDRQPNAANPTSALLMENGVISPLVISPYNRDTSDRFTILVDKRYNVTAQNAVQTINNTIFSGYKKLNRIVKYNDTNGGTVADIISNNLFAWMVSNDATNSPVAAIGFRVYYKDT